MLRRRAVAWLLMTLMWGCGSSDTGNSGNQECVPGFVNSCPCADETSGTQECSPDGIFGPCVCGDAVQSSDTSDPDVTDSGDVEPTADGDVLAVDGQDVPEPIIDLGPPPCMSPMEWACIDATSREKCNPETGLLETEICPPETACDEATGTCLEPICEPAATECLGEDHYKECNETGTQWLMDLPCQQQGEEATYCDPSLNQCICELPIHVLFLLDASGSMQMQELESGDSQWAIALQAISLVMETYPFLTYGLSTFPNQTVSCGPEACAGNGGCDYVDSINLDLAQGQTGEINEYLANRILSEDPAMLDYVRTPLLGIIDHLLTGYPDDGPLKNHPYPAYVVLISDGQDSCFNTMNPSRAIGPLGLRTIQLLQAHGVKTFAVGFNLENGQDQLDAVAMHGGTGLANYVAANDLGTLTAAFENIFMSMDIRDCDGWTDDILPPDCVDADEDSWCSFLDCDDENAEVNYGHQEVQGNQLDDDCDGLTDEPSDNQLDQDGDGFAPSEGDCNDLEPLIAPTSWEVTDDGIDNDCDGATDENDCTCAQSTGTSLDAMLCSTEIGCNPGWVLSSNMSSPTGDDISTSWAAVNHFGSPSNHLAAKQGGSYALIASGPATGTSHSMDLFGGGPMTDPFASELMYDAVEFTVTLTAPPNAVGFSIDYVFFSEEFDDYVGNIFNDKFYIILNAPETTQGQETVINFTECRNPASYFDLSGDECPLDSGYCCYIAVNTALAECCWYGGCPDGTWTTDISGTGFSCANNASSDWSDTGSSTGWLRTTWPIEPNETFTIRFHIHDSGDGIFDSEVILDNFIWKSTGVSPGTESSAGTQ